MPLKKRKLTSEQERKALVNIWDFHYNASMAREPFMQRYRSAMRVYHDLTIDDAGRQLLYQRGQSDVSINFLRILLRKMQAYMSANQPQWAAFGVNDDDTRSAKLINAILGHGWRISYGYLQIVDLIKKGLVGGVGLWSSFFDYRSDNGLGDVRWKSLPVQFFYPDWRSMDWMYDDMAAQQVSYTVDLPTAFQMVPKSKHEKLKSLSTVPGNYDTLIEEGNFTFGQFPDPIKGERVRVLTHYTLEQRPIWELRHLVDGSTYLLNERPSLPLPYAVDIVKKDIPSLVRYDCVYGMGEDDGIILDVTEYPYRKFIIKPFINEFTENPYGVGEAYFLEKLQNYVDKSLRVALQHEMWNSNPGVFVPSGSFRDKKEAEKKILWPGFMLEMDMDDGKKPIFKQGVPGQSGFYNIMNTAIGAMREATGNMFRPEMSKGNATEDQLLKMQGQEQGDAIFRQFEATLEEGAAAYVMLAREHYDYPKQLRFIDKKRRPSTLPVNIAFVNENGELDDGYRIKDIGIDISIASRSYAPTEKFLNQKMLIEAMNRAPGEVADILFIEFMKAMEIDPEVVEEIDARLQILPQLMQQMQQMAQTIEELQTVNSKLEDNLFNAERKAIRSGYEAELEGLISKFKSQMATTTQIWQNKLKSNEEMEKKLAQANRQQEEKAKTEGDKK